MQKQKRLPTIRTNILHIVRHKWYYVLAVLVIGLALLLILMREHHQDTSTTTPPNPDMIVYRVDYGELGTGPLMLYDPQTQVETPILPPESARSYAVSANGRVAFTSQHEGNIEVYVRDTLPATTPTTNISQNSATIDHPLAWSQDNRYLAFTSHTGFAGGNHIMVWDSETGTTIDITPDNLADMATFDGDNVVWSNNGQLAFVVRYDYMGPAEIFVWDGQRTMRLSQNRSYRPTWSPKNELAFTLLHDDRNAIVVWDGVSTKDGMPDTESFTVVSSGSYYHSLLWINANRLGFVAFPEEGDAQAFVWDGHTITNISEPIAASGESLAWSIDGQWAFIDDSSRYTSTLYVQNADNNNVLTTDARYTPAWSTTGDLMFCNWEGRWVLYLWDGDKIIEVVRGGGGEGYIVAQWLSGTEAFCSRYSE